MNQNTYWKIKKKRLGIFLPFPMFQIFEYFHNLAIKYCWKVRNFKIIPCQTERFFHVCDEIFSHHCLITEDTDLRLICDQKSSVTKFNFGRGGSDAPACHLEPKMQNIYKTILQINSTMTLYFQSLIILNAQKYPPFNKIHMLPYWNFIFHRHRKIETMFFLNFHKREL